MLQISQTENPMCSATIDQIRLRRAMVLPVVFQNVSSSGFHSEIQVEFDLLTEDSLSAAQCPFVRRHRCAHSQARRRTLGRPQPGGGTVRMDWFSTDGFDGVSTSHSSFVPTAFVLNIVDIAVAYHNAMRRPLCSRRIENLRFAQFLCAAQR